jgi:hypothetical protein
MSIIFDICDILLGSTKEKHKRSSNTIDKYNKVNWILTPLTMCIKNVEIYMYTSVFEFSG